MFSPRQLLVHALLYRAIMTVGNYDFAAREFTLGAFQQYLRNQNTFCIWDISRDCLAPHMSNNNYHPKATPVENCVFGSLGRGNWTSCVEAIVEGAEWADAPWEPVATQELKRNHPDLVAGLQGKS